MIHREIGVKSKIKVVISLLRSQFSSTSQIQSAIEAIDYAGKEHLRLRGTITGKGTILGNVMILDLNIPLGTTNSHDVEARFGEFNRAVVRYLTSGKVHVTSGRTLGGFGALNVGYVNPTASRPRTVKVTVETDLTNTEVLRNVEQVGRVTNIEEPYIW